ncbi:uncharacterized protein K452DRAFT_278557 [Aplosporella prunicola CBS 121167]|uniref:C3H1-type domain-containing protein n=1 Tax=Aplosporella prunicola CBS 121167 TaxID=1176127 RepID=A0A6A6B3J6_9PEZI|nr:uncharacterized protein K452DRAFT_278557 [Aplosporella prunicola CBS 121167]KAF2137547.1 hypothetical protein K452DRAFT_278557 [Aplosporella prunicola CBS 121167]
MPNIPSSATNTAAMSDQFSTHTPVSHTSTDGTAAGLWRRHEQLKTVEYQKNELIEELLYRYEYLSEQLKKESEDHEREREYNRTAQRTIKEHRTYIVTLQAVMQRDPFALVLIDGDGMIFTDSLLRQAEEGGKTAAGRLETQLEEHLNSRLPDIPGNCKLVVRIYANLKGLGETCRSAGIIANTADVEAFAKGFTRNKPLFDFVDVGPGKDRADEKLCETFKLHLYDSHCRHIFFGCSHDNGYARLLEPLVTNPDLVPRVTLIEGVPFEKELAILPFETKKFDNLFRTQKINLYGNGTSGFGPSLLLSNIAFRNPSSTTSGSTTPPLLGVGAIRVATPPVNGNPVSWAGAAAKAAALPAPKPAAAMVTLRDPNVVPRNRKGQRIDPPLKYDRDEFNRVKRLKMCNVHFLRQECPYGLNCTHKHDYKPTKDEIETLKFVARSATCIHGTGCDDIKCMYGHHCPYPKNPAKKTGKNCIWGDECKFSLDMHNMDSAIVSTMTIRN